MRFTIQINSSPYHSSSGDSALAFIHAALDNGHVISQVLFYHEGIYHAFRKPSPFDAQTHFSWCWNKLAKTHHIDLLVCISAAQRRVLIDETQPNFTAHLADGFRISGLGQWVEAALLSDRHIIFG